MEILKEQLPLRKDGVLSPNQMPQFRYSIQICKERKKMDAGIFGSVIETGFGCKKARRIEIDLFLLDADAPISHSKHDSTWPFLFWHSPSDYPGP